MRPTLSPTYTLPHYDLPCVVFLNFFFSVIPLEASGWCAVCNSTSFPGAFSLAGQSSCRAKHPRSVVIFAVLSRFSLFLFPLARFVNSLLFGVFCFSSFGGPHHPTMIEQLPLLVVVLSVKPGGRTLQQPPSSTQPPLNTILRVICPFAPPHVFLNPTPTKAYCRV